MGGGEERIKDAVKKVRLWLDISCEFESGGSAASPLADTLSPSLSTVSSLPRQAQNHPCYSTSLIRMKAAATSARAEPRPPY